MKVAICGYGGITKINSEHKKQPYCCSECCYARFLKFPKPLCIITNKAFTHNTAKSKADWCPIKNGKTIDDFRKEKNDSNNMRNTIHSDRFG